MKKVICSLSIIAFLMGTTTPVTLHAEEKQASISIGDSETYNITEQQLKTVKKQEGISYVKDKPKVLPTDYIAVSIPEELGGGYLVGSKENIAKAFNTAGITVGLTATAVSKEAKIVGGILVVALAGILISALSGGSSSTHKHPSE